MKQDDRRNCWCQEAKFQERVPKRVHACGHVWCGGEKVLQSCLPIRYSTQTGLAVKHLNLQNFYVSKLFLTCSDLWIQIPQIEAFHWPVRGLPAGLIGTVWRRLGDYGPVKKPLSIWVGMLQPILVVEIYWPSWMKISEAFVTEMNLIVSAKVQDHRAKLAYGGQEQPLQLRGRILHKVSAHAGQ